jgi:hypothetical protein
MSLHGRTGCKRGGGCAATAYWAEGEEKAMCSRMWRCWACRSVKCENCGYLMHDGCCEGCVGHAIDGLCITLELLEAEDQEELIY